MNLISATAPVWANADHTKIDLTATFDTLGQIPYTTDAGSEIFARAESGEFGAVADFPTARGDRESAAIAKQAAVRRVAEIKSTLVEHLLTLQVGTPAEKALATAAANQIRAELALEKSKL